MSNLLIINSSPNGDYSKSSQLTERFSKEMSAITGELKVTVRDLGANPIPHLNPVTLSGFFSDPEQHSDEQVEATRVSTELIAELKLADIVIIGAAMHNFMVTSGLKAYIDQVARAGETFKYTDKGPVGLLKDKKVYVIKASGGDYSEMPMKGMDFLQPYLTFMLGFIGLDDVTFINHGGAAMGPDMAKAAESKTHREISQAVLELSKKLDLEVSQGAAA